MNDIELRVKKIVSRQLNVSANDIEYNNSIVDDLGGDSLDAVELVLTLEDEFDIEISEENAEQFRTVQHVIDYLKNM